MKKYIFLLLACYSCHEDCKISVKREKLTTIPDFYVFAFRGNSGTCGVDFLSIEEVNKLIESEGGLSINNAFCCKTENGYRVFTTKHTFFGCGYNPHMTVENVDVVSLPYHHAIQGFEIATPKENSCVTVKGFRILETQEWIEISGTLKRGTLMDFSERFPEVKRKSNWNSGKMWLMATSRQLSPANLRGLSGAPVVNDEGKIVGLFSGIYAIEGGKHMPDGNYLRIEALTQ